MAIKEGKISAGGTGKDVDTTVVTQTGGSEVHREAVFLADPEENLQRAQVIRVKPALSKKSAQNTYAASMAEVQMSRLISAIETLVDQNETIIMQLESMSN